MPHVIVIKFQTVGNPTNGFLRSFLRFEIWQSVFLALPQGKERNAECKKKDHYQIWQGRNPDGGYGGGVPEVLPAMVAAEKKEQRNREAMEAQGYRTESYEEWKENDMRTELFQRAWRK